jgi:5-methylcytosine-specific restriction protein A
LPAFLTPFWRSSPTSSASSKQPPVRRGVPSRPPAPCTWPGCGALVYGGGRCDEHKTAARRYVDRQRGTPGQRGYGATHRRRFRAGVLRRDPYCRCDLTDCDHGDAPCPRPSTVADHWPLDRRELVRRGLDPDDPGRGRGLCARCDSRQTAIRQPGGWHRPKAG